MIMMITVMNALDMVMTISSMMKVNLNAIVHSVHSMTVMMNMKIKETQIIRFIERKTL